MIGSWLSLRDFLVGKNNKNTYRLYDRFCPKNNPIPAVARFLYILPLSAGTTWQACPVIARAAVLTYDFRTRAKVCGQRHPSVEVHIVYYVGVATHRSLGAALRSNTHSSGVALFCTWYCQCLLGTVYSLSLIHI